MKGLENTTYLIALIVSNIAALIILWAAIKKPVIARLLFSILFEWASWMNYTTAINYPEKYLEYASMSIGLYKSFINGWFKDHITSMVCFIASCQALIGVGMLLNKWWVKLASISAVIFFIAIAPLGVGAAFPFSLIASAAAIVILIKDEFNYSWKHSGINHNIKLNRK